MTVAINYDSVVEQLLAIGLIPLLPLETGKRIRCKVEGDHEKRGWYHLHEFRKDDGTDLLVGSFGVWHSTDPNSQKIQLDKTHELSKEQSTALRVRMAEDQKRAAAVEKIAQEKAAHVAGKMWARLSEDGECAYLSRKHVIGHGVRYTPQGNMAVPMLDTSGKVWGLQIIYGDKKGKRGRDKDFWPEGLAKKAHFFQIGSPDWLILVAEGYATGASLHEATGYPVAIAFDAGNLMPVATALRKRYPRAKILICADDDYVQRCHNPIAGGTPGKPKRCHKYSLSTATLCAHCGGKLRARNTGITDASTAAIAVGGGWVAPKFEDERPADRKGLTDFNDLHVAEGLHVVRAQVEAHLTALDWHVPKPAARGDTPAGGRGALAPILSPYDLDERYTLIYGSKGAVFDHDHHLLVAIEDVRNLCISKEFVRRWLENPMRKVATVANVGFDPTDADPNVTCNLWAGWPTTPVAGECSELLELLYYLCKAESNPDELYQWIIKWMAYPLQHQGAKMKTALVFHGPQGTGKNLLWEAYGKIFDKYYAVIDQGALEDKHNDWASGKLFMIADEVIAQKEMRHIKNRLKGMVTSAMIRINPKHITAHTERNHCNLVFLSNEAMPLVLERDDRRYLVIWTPPKQSKDVYTAIQREIDEGGIAALHEYLLRVDLSGFTPETEPPITRSKRELQGISMDSWEQFAHEWISGALDDALPSPAPAEVLYRIYHRWAERNGNRFVENKNSFLLRVSRLSGFAKRERQKVFADGKERQITILYPPGKTEMPDLMTMACWNQESYDNFVNNFDRIRSRPNAT